MLWKCILCGEVFEGSKPPEICPVCGADSSQFVVENTSRGYREDIDKERFVIIGNGAAGYYCAKTIRENNPDCHIIIVSKEKYHTYYRPQLSEYLTVNIPDNKLYICSPEWYEKNNIKLILGISVTKILTAEKKLILENNEELVYDKLIIASGSSNFVPPIQGSDKSGVFTLRSLTDADKIKEAMKVSKNAVVIGGGLLGLEAAWEIKKAGLTATVVEFAERLLPKQLDEESAKLLKASADKAGITVILGDSAEEILGDNKVTGVKLKSGKFIPAELVLFSVGIRPNLSIVKETDITFDKGINVNKRMETSVEDIFACGDAVELDGTLFGTWAAAIQMGKIAGTNAAGGNMFFTDYIPSFVFSAMNIKLFSSGTFQNKYDALSWRSAEKNILKNFFFDENVLKGIILYGDIMQSGKAIKAVREGESIKKIPEIFL